MAAQDPRLQELLKSLVKEQSEEDLMFALDRPVGSPLDIAPLVSIKRQLKKANPPTFTRPLTELLIRILCTPRSFTERAHLVDALDAILQDGTLAEPGAVLRTSEDPHAIESALAAYRAAVAQHYQPPAPAAQSRPTREASESAAEEARDDEVDRYLRGPDIPPAGEDETDATPM
ncbi:hypothetical protein PAPYR_107 [Paratrimastix pyriformis]|uniref:Uncharacterized protein n=1 Tax=Paratrimastix pyriformis TaxID=342808 RepID=A0ABQ8UUV8_9EUKA|nr:hypothetical protein PAPYR_107 [Paratrimastix pyriformis]